MAQNYQEIIVDLLQQKPVAFNPSLARLTGSVKAGLFLSQLLYWWGKGNNPEWVYKTIEDFEEETALSREEQDSAIRRLKQLGIIEVKLMGMPARRHFKINANQLLSLCKTRKPVCVKPANLFVENTQTNTDNTTDNKDTNVSLSSTEDGGRYGNKKVNFLLEEFERRYEYPPTDRKPRYEAWILARKIDAWIRSYGKDPNDVFFTRAASALFEWIEKQDWGERVQLIGTIRRKSVIFLKPKEVKNATHEQKPTQI